jgi:hypothetical protein
MRSFRPGDWILGIALLLTACGSSNRPAADAAKPNDATPTPDQSPADVAVEQHSQDVPLAPDLETDAIALDAPGVDGPGIDAPGVDAILPPLDGPGAIDGFFRLDG